MSAQRAIVMILATYVGLIVTSALQALSPWRIPTPEVALLVVVYLGLGGRGTAPAHVGVALAIGYLADLFAGSPKGLETLTLGVAMVLARAGSSRLDVATPWHTLVIAAAATLGHALVLLGLSSTMYGGDATAALRVVPASVLTTAIVAPLCFSLLQRVDRRLLPDPRALRMA